MVPSVSRTFPFRPGRTCSRERGTFRSGLLQLIGLVLLCAKRKVLTPSAQVGQLFEIIERVTSPVRVVLFGVDQFWGADLKKGSFEYRLKGPDGRLTVTLSVGEVPPSIAMENRAPSGSSKGPWKLKGKIKVAAAFLSFDAIKSYSPCL